MQLRVADVDQDGRMTGQSTAYALSGFVRTLGEGDDSLNRLASADGYLKQSFSYAR